jgi:putative ABC transport system permease protein
MRLPIAGVISLAFRRLRSRPILTALSLVGVILAVGMVASVPVFAQAVSYLVLRDEIAAIGPSKNVLPLALRVVYEIRRQPFTLGQALDMEQTLARTITDKTGLSPQLHVTYAESPLLLLRSKEDSTTYDPANEKLVFKGFTLAVLGHVQDRITTVDGQPFGQATASDHLPVWPSVKMADSMGLQVGERYNLFPRGADQGLPIQIAGLWKEKDIRDGYWGALPLSREGAFLVTEDDYIKAVQPLFPEGTSSTIWYFAPELSSLTLDKVDKFAYGLDILPTLTSHTLPTAQLDMSPVEPLRRYVQRRDTLSTLLVNFSLPAIALLFYFLALLSTVIVQFQQEETSILSGRGAGTAFLVGLSFLETAILIIIGAPLGLFVGYLMARLMGQTASFLTFVSRPGFPASLNGTNWRLLAFALVLLFVARLAPTLNASRKSLVMHLRERSRQISVSWMVKAAIDIPLIVLTLYVYRQLKVQDIPSLFRLDTKADVFREPLYLLAPLLCVFTATLVLVHLFPVVMRPLDRLSTRLPWLSPYMGIRRLHEQSGQYTNALFLVIVCLSLGSFYSSMALSLDAWLHDRIYFAVGTDYTFRPSLYSPQGSEGGSGQAWTLPLSDYLALPGVEQATQVADYQARVATPKNSALRSRLLAIDRTTFPQAAFFRRDFITPSLGDALNRLGRQRNGILVSRQFVKQNNLLEGQKLTVDLSVGGSTQKVDFVIAGVYDNFPTAYPRQMETLVGNLGYISEQTGDPSQSRIWLRTTPGVTGDDIMAQAKESGILPLSVGDARLLLDTENERPERIGIFGILSIGFIAGSILSWIGLLAYTSASMQGRMQQIGVLKAIGVQTRQVLMMEGIEYAGVITYGIVGGVAAGLITSWLFVPFFQFNVTAATALPPFLPMIDWTRIGMFAVVSFLALLTSEVAILYQATRKDIFQALRMGQRE